MSRRRGGLIGLLGTGVGMAAEYREHRKEQKLSRENSQQDQTAVAGPSSSGLQSGQPAPSSSSDLPPAYADVAGEGGDRSIASGKPASSDKKAALSQYEDEDYDSSDSDTESVEDDEEDWELDEILSRTNSADGPPSYEDSEREQIPVDTLVRDVMNKNSSAMKTMSPESPFVRTPLPCPVIIPQRRPRKKARGFVRAYAPHLGECSGISQDTFLAFLDNFYKSSQASPVFGVIQVSAAIAGLAPSVIAMAVTTAVQIGARVGAEVQSRHRTNDFLDRMNEELFKPAGLYAMVVKYKSEQEVAQSGNSLLARFGVSGEQVDFNTNATIAKYNRTISDSSTSGDRSMSDRMKNLRLASGTTKGAINLPEAAPLIFPDVDKAILKDGEETFKDKAKDAKDFLADYMDRRAQMQYARDDPTSTLAVPESQRQFKSSLSDPQHPMYQGGIINFATGGALSKARGGISARESKRARRNERRIERTERRIDDGRRVSRKGERRYERALYEEQGMYGRGYGYGGQGYGYEQRGFGGGRRRGGPIGLVGGLISAATNAASSSSSNAPAPHAPYGSQPQPHQSYGSSNRSLEYEDSYNRQSGYDTDPRMARRSFDDRATYGYQGQSSSGSQPYAPYGGRRPRDRRQRKGGVIGTVKRVMREDVLYLMIVNMPSEAELAEAREILARAG